VARPGRWKEIVEVAANLFLAKGFSATSLEDIAREVGMYKGSLYHYIESKEDLLFAVVREPAELILGEVRAMMNVDLPPSEKIRRLARIHTVVLQENFAYASVYLNEVAGRDRSDEWSAMDREYLAALVEIIREGQRRGEFSSDLDPRISALALIGSLNWVTHWYRPDGVLTGSEIADRFSEFFLGGLLSRSRA
jgi:AcrR family transcriptional regulator